MQEISAQQHLLPVVVFAAMATIGMELRVSQLTKVIEAPRVPLLGTLIHTLTFPVIALIVIVGAILLSISLTEATVIGILLIAACPSGGFSNVLTSIARANLPLSVVLTGISTMIALLTVPLLLSGFGFFVESLRVSGSVPILDIFSSVAGLVFLPLVLGMMMAAKLKFLSTRLISISQQVAQLMLYGVVVLLIVENWPVMKLGVSDALPISLLLCMLNIGLCLMLSRLARLTAADAVTVALEGSTRNLAVAFLVAANSLERIDVALLPTVYFVSVLIASILFAKSWRKLPL